MKINKAVTNGSGDLMIGSSDDLEIVPGYFKARVSVTKVAILFIAEGWLQLRDN